MSCRRSRRSRLLVVVATIVALVGTLTSPANAAPPDPTISDVIGRFSGATDVAWAPCPDGETPLAFANDRLLGVGLSPETATYVEEVVLKDVLVGVEIHAYGVVSFEITKDPLEWRDIASAEGVDLHLDHVFFFDGFWRFHPYEAPTATSADTTTIRGIGSINRPIVVLDTGYPSDADLPESYTLGERTLDEVDDRSPTANHGPFIASQVALWTNARSKDIILQRILADKGAIQEPAADAEAYFDEIALLETLKASDLDDAVVNMSFGTYGCEQGYHRPAALEYAMNQEHIGRGATFVTAAGNDETSAWHYPSAFVVEHDWVTSVGAHDGEPRKRREPSRACFSNFGHVEIWAPGEDMFGELPTPDGPVMAQGSGTSFAAPFVAAVSAMGRPTDDARLGLFTTVTDDSGSRSTSTETACG